MYRDKNIFVDIYKIYVRPVLEASVVVWNPRKKEDAKRLEKVQRRALRSVKGLEEKSYSDRLEECGINSLEFRRSVIDLCDEL